MSAGGHPTNEDLSPEDLRHVLDAVLAFSRVVGSPDYERVLPALLRIVAETLGVDVAVTYFVDEASTCLVFGGAHGDVAGLGDAFPRLPLDDRAAPALAGAGLRHVGVVPVQLRGRPYAVFQLGRRSGPPIAARELRMTQLLADLVIVYIENARLYTEARRRLDETHMLLEVARAVTASLELDDRLEAAAQVLARLIDASNAFVLLLDEDGNTLRCVACNEPRWKGEACRIAVARGTPSIAWRSVLTRSPVAVVDAERSTEVHQGLVARFGEKSLLALPLLLRGEPIGVVVVDDTRARRAWSAAEVARAELIVHQVASAVATARLHGQVRRGYDELARAQAELVKRERLAALGQLSATLAHEVRNPLGVLFNSIGTLGKKLPQDDEARMLLGIMSEEAHRLERLVRELLDFARPLSPTLESESLKAVADGAIDGALAELGAAAARIVNEIDGTLKPVRIDAGMMRRALLNLLVNGAQAAGPGGTVVVRASAVTRDGRSFVELEVTDDGPGIPEQIQPRIFEPFFTTRATGTGLGLAVVRGIVEAHGGEIAVRSPTDAGATIAVQLRADDPMQP